MTRLSFATISFFVIMVFSGCSKSEDPTRYALPVQMDLSGATALAILEFNSERTRVDSYDYNIHNNLFTQNSENEFDPVMLRDSEGNEVEVFQFSVFNIIDFHKDYFWIYGDIVFLTAEDEEYPLEHLLVNKFTGQFYEMREAYLPYLWHDTERIYYVPDIFKWQSDHVVYYGQSYNSSSDFKAAYKLDISDPAALVHENLLPDSQTYERFEVDNNGNFFYQDGSSLKVKTTSGNVLTSVTNSRIWSNNNNQIFTISDNTLFELSINDNNELTKEIINGVPEIGGFSVAFKTNDFSILIGDSVWKHDYSSNTVSSLDIELPGHILQITNDVAFFEEEGQGLITMLNLSDFTTSSFSMPTDQFEFHDFQVNHSGTISFSAFRYSDGKDVYGTIQHDGSISIEGESEFTITLFYPFSSI